MFDEFGAPKRRAEMDLNVVPILDMLMCVIFFLLLTTTFMALTKQTIPPAAVSTLTDPVVPPPLTPKLAVVKNADQMKLVLSWSGADPGVMVSLSGDAEADLLKATADLAQRFLVKYPSERTIQIGMGAQVPYQTLMTVMDAVKDKMPDMVLYDYQEAAVRAAASEK